MLFGLHALGQHPQLEGLAQADNCTGDGLVVRVVADAPGEFAVDLECGQRQAAQVAQGGLPGAKVVDRHRHTEVHQALEHGRGGVDVLDQDTFGDLHLEALGRETGGLQGLQDALGQVGVRELARGQVDRQAQRRQPPAVPLHQLLRGGAQHPVADRDDQTGLFRQRDEVARRDHPALRVAPADEGLDADGVPPIQAGLWLIMELELALAQRRAQPLLQLQLLARPGVQPLRVEAAGVAAGVLGLVQGTGRMAQQLVPAACILRVQADAGTDGGHMLAVAEGERLGAVLQDGLRAIPGLGRGPDRGQDQGELVRGQPCEGVARLQLILQPLCQCLQQGVPGVVSQGAVDRGEAVDVQQQYRQWFPLALGLVEGGAQAGAQPGPVGEAGQGVEVHQLEQGLFGLLAFGQVLMDTEDAGGRLLRPFAFGQHVARLAAGESQAMPDREAVGLAVGQAQQGKCQRGAIIRMGGLHQGLAGQGAGLVAMSEEFACLGREVDLVGFQVQVPVADAGHALRGQQALMAVLQGLFGAHAFLHLMGQQVDGLAQVFGLFRGVVRPVRSLLAQHDELQRLPGMLAGPDVDQGGTGVAVLADQIHRVASRDPALRPGRLAQPLVQVEGPVSRRDQAGQVAAVQTAGRGAEQALRRRVGVAYGAVSGDEEDRLAQRVHQIEGGGALTGLQSVGHGISPDLRWSSAAACQR